MRTALRGALIGAVTAATVLTCGTAGATPSGPGVTARTITERTVDGTDYTCARSPSPGQSTGWHYHDGPLYGVVRQGTLSHFDSSCASDGVYRAGSPVKEPAGPGHVHIGRNLGDTPVVLDVWYVLPHGSPFSEDAPNPGCAFQ